MVTLYLLLFVVISAVSIAILFGLSKWCDYLIKNKAPFFIYSDAYPYVLRIINIVIGATLAYDFGLFNENATALQAGETFASVLLIANALYLCENICIWLFFYSFGKLFGDRRHRFGHPENPRNIKSPHIPLIGWLDRKILIKKFKRTFEDIILDVKNEETSNRITEDAKGVIACYKHYRPYIKNKTDRDCLDNYKETVLSMLEGVPGEVTHSRHLR